MRPRRSWRRAPLAEVTDPIARVDWATWGQPDFVYIDVGSIDNTALAITAPKTLHVAVAPARAQQIVQPGDVLFSTVRTYLHNIAMVPDGWPRPIASTAFAVLRASDRVLPMFLFYYVQSPNFIRTVSAMQRGVSYPAVTDAQVRRMTIPLPSLDEQTHIVAELQAAFAAMERGSQSLRRGANRLGLLHSGVINAAVQAASERVAGSSASHLGEFIAIPLANGRSVRDAGSGGFPVLRLGAVRGGHIDLSQQKMGAWTADEARPFLVRKGDFLVVRGNGSKHLVARGGIVPSGPPVAFPDTLIRVRPSAALSVSYLQLLWDSRHVRRQLESRARTSAGIYKVNQHDLATLEIPVPRLADQQWLVDDSQDRLAKIRTLHTVLATAQHRSEQLRAAVLQTTFYDEDLDDQPLPSAPAVDLRTTRSHRGEQRHRRRVRQ